MGKWRVCLDVMPNCGPNAELRMGNLVTIFGRLLLLALCDCGWAQRTLFGRCDALLLAITFNESALMHVICAIRRLCSSSNG